MPGVKISQTELFFHECNAWERSLEFFRQECAFLKNRLAEVVDNNIDKDFLSVAEHFQNQFILKDEFTAELRQDVLVQLKELGKQPPENVTDGRLSKKQTKLRNEIQYLEKEFTALRNEFNKCLLSGL